MESEKANVRADLRITYDPALDRAVEIAKADIRMCMGVNRCGCRGVIPAGRGYSDGVWLADAIWSFDDGIIYWMSGSEARDYLYSEAPGAMGVIPFFANLQEETGEHAGNIPIAKYLSGTHDYDIDYGGMFDLSYSPRKNHRDEVPAGAFFIHGMYRYWKLFNDKSYIIKYYDAMHKYMRYRQRGLDEATGLFRSTYGLGDVCIDHAVPRSCALVRVNCECHRMFDRFSEMAEAIGKEEDAGTYRRIAERIRDGINTHLWNRERKRYEMKVFCNPTTDESSPAYGITEDDRFFVVDNMALLYFGVPDSQEKTEALIDEIEKAESGLRLYGQSVEPPYPDGWHNRIFDGGRYWNGDVWPSFASWYAISLFRLGYPDKAMDVLTKQAEVAVRDGGFYEYYEDDANGAGKGAFRYCFTAAPYLRAMVEGLFGLDADYPNQKVHICPSLRRSGNVTCQLGMHSIDMTVNVDDHAAARKLTIKTTYSGPTNFRVLIKDGATVCKVTKDMKRDLPCNVKKIGDATYAVFESGLDAGTSTLDLRCK